MDEAIKHNTKVNLLAFLSMCLFVVTGFISILSWLLFMIPVVITFYMYDCKHECLYQKSTNTSLLDYFVYFVCLVEVICCITSIYKPNSITAALKILLLAVFYFFVRTFIRFRSQFSILYIGIAILSGLLSLISILFFLIHRDKFYSVGFDDLTNFRQYYRPFGQLSNDWATVLLCLLPFSLIHLFNGTKGKWRSVFLFIGILNVIALLVSFSRGAYLALFTFFLCAVGGTIFCGWRNIRKSLIVFGVVLLPSFLLMYPESKAVLTTCSLFETTSQQRSINGRFVKWKEAIGLFRLFPATGVGGGNYALASDMYPQERQGLFTTRSTNSYLQIATEKGLVGILAYGGLFCVILGVGSKQLYKGSLVATVFLSGIIALWVRELTFSSLFEKDTLLVLFFLMLLAIVQPVKNEGYELFGVVK